MAPSVPIAKFASPCGSLRELAAYSWELQSTTLGLPVGCAHHQAVELGRHLHLAGQARVRLHVVAEVEHVLLHRRRLAHRRTPRLVDMHVAGGAGAGAAAFRLDAGNAVLDGRLHHGRAELTLDRAGGAFMIDIGDFRHTIGGTIQDTRQRWRPIAAHTRARQMTPDIDRRARTLVDGHGAVASSTALRVARPRLDGPWSGTATAVERRPPRRARTAARRQARDIPPR